MATTTTSKTTPRGAVVQGEEAQQNEEVVVDVVDDDDFIVRRLEDGIFLVRERFFRNKRTLPNIYVVQGPERDLVVDSGHGIWNLPDFLKRKKLIGGPSAVEMVRNDDGGGATAAATTKSSTKKKKPCTVVATHVHFDHAGGLHQFAAAGAVAGDDDETEIEFEIAIHQNEAEALQSGDSYEAGCLLSQRDCGIGKLPHPRWKAREYRFIPTDPSRILQDGDVIDLGGGDLRFHVLHLPGHSRGSIGLWDETRGYFFSGDVIYDGPKLDFFPYGSIEDNVDSIERVLQEIVPRAKRTFPGHGETLDKDKLKDVATLYLRHVGCCRDCCAEVVGRTVLTLLLKGRNTQEIGPKCCYYSCCCCLCL